MDRAAALAALVHMEGPVSAAVAKLQEFPWDSDIDLVVMTAMHFSHALRRYCLGEISASEIEDWANALESREDLGFASAALRELLHELANPLLTEPLTQSRAQHLLEHLS